MTAEYPNQLDYGGHTPFLASGRHSLIYAEKITYASGEKISYAEKITNPSKKITYAEKITNSSEIITYSSEKIRVGVLSLRKRGPPPTWAT